MFFDAGVRIGGHATVVDLVRIDSLLEGAGDPQQAGQVEFTQPPPGQDLPLPRLGRHPQDCEHGLTTGASGGVDGGRPRRVGVIHLDQPTLHHGARRLGQVHMTNFTGCQ